MSGGVDSSVVAALLSEMDVDLRAVYMRNWSTMDEQGAMQAGSGGAMGCEWQREWDDVQRVCRHLGGIPVELVDLSREYWVDVFEPAIGQWSDGTTPNPDVTCNRYVAQLTQRHQVWRTDGKGHYARIAYRMQNGAPTPYIQRAIDPSKDQSYYLSSVPSERLRSAFFPLGSMHKADVRATARRLALPTAENPESMGLCFVGERGAGAHAFARFLDNYLESTPGHLLAPDGGVLGQHQGLHSLTIGQRARIGGRPERYFVARKDAKANTMTVVPGKYCLWLTTDTFHWAADAPALPMPCSAQVRYRQAAAPCVAHDAGHGKVRVDFHEPMLAVAAGQAVALYDDDVCLGSATIEHVHTADSVH